jgi:hypothetical protein
MARKLTRAFSEKFKISFEESASVQLTQEYSDTAILSTTIDKPVSVS